MRGKAIQVKEGADGATLRGLDFLATEAGSSAKDTVAGAAGARRGGGQGVLGVFGGVVPKLPTPGQSILNPPDP